MAYPVAVRVWCLPTDCTLEPLQDVNVRLVGDSLVQLGEVGPAKKRENATYVQFNNSEVKAKC